MPEASPLYIIYVYDEINHWPVSLSHLRISFKLLLFLPVPRQPGVSNNLLETFEIERGISADEDEANDDPGSFIYLYSFGGGGAKSFFFPSVHFLSSLRHDLYNIFISCILNVILEVTGPQVCACDEQA